MTIIVNGYEIKPGADLMGANLSEVDLYGVNLRRANLSGANLAGADLSWVDLRRANLTDANLEKADLRGSNFVEANLTGANFSGANLGHDGPNSRSFVGCIGLEFAIFDDGVKEKLMAGIEALKAEMD